MSTASHSPASTASSTDKSSLAPRPSPPPPPGSFCHGLADETDAKKLVHPGTASVLLVGTVTTAIRQKPRPGPRFNLASYRLLAGSTGRHPLRNIIGAPVKGRHLLVLLWDGFAWEVSGALLGGDFIISGHYAYQRCPNFGRPQVPSYTRQGVTSLSELKRLLRRALG